MVLYSLFVDHQGRTLEHQHQEEAFDADADRNRRLATRHDPRNARRSRFGRGGRFCDEKDEEAVRIAIEEGYPPYPSHARLVQSHAEWLRTIEEQDWEKVSDALVIDETLFHSDIIDRSLNGIRDKRQLPQTRACYEKHRDEGLQRVLSDIRAKLPINYLPNESMNMSSSDNTIGAIRYYLRMKVTGRVYYKELNEERFAAHWAYNRKRGLPRPPFDEHRGEVKALEPQPEYWQEWLDTEEARRTERMERAKLIDAQARALCQKVRNQGGHGSTGPLSTPIESVAPPSTPPSQVPSSTTTSATQPESPELRSPVSVTTGRFSRLGMVSTTIRESTEDDSSDGRSTRSASSK